jgi:hypothetical protein
VLGSIDLEGDLNRVVDAIKAWLDLQGNTRWLLIYDNYDNPGISNESDHLTVDIRQYLPESDQGSIIITTRSARVTQGRRLHVQKLTGLEDGLKILANTSRREDITNGVLDKCKTSDIELTGQIPVQESSSRSLMACLWLSPLLGLTLST